MLVMRAYRHKARFTPVQEQLAARFAGCARLVYNSGLEQRKVGYQATGLSMSYMRQTYFLKEVKTDPEFEFLREAPAHVLQQALLDLDRAFRNFFAGKAAYPKPRRRGERDGFRFPDPTQIGVHNPARVNQVRLPKLGWVSVRNCWPRLGDRLFEGNLKYVSVVREADGWWVSFTCEVEMEDPAPVTSGLIGLDLGVVNTVATSKGDLIQLPVLTDREWEKIGLLQAALARKEKGSRNREKARRRLARYRKRLRDRKRDATHKLTTRLAREHALIAIEDLQVRNMTRSARGTLVEPGSNVAQKAGLNRAILDQSWGEIRRQLNYKTQWTGTTLAVVDPRNTSRECHACGHTAPENRENQAVFRCVVCGHEAHADTNAAQNILQRALGTLGTPTDGTSEREPARTGSHACEDPTLLKTPEVLGPSRKARPRGPATKPAPSITSLV